MRKRGFTLVELMLVVAILGILATAVVMSLGGQHLTAMHGAAKADMHGLKQAIAHYKVDHGRFPPDLHVLYEGADPYLENPPPLDPWGYEYELQIVDGRPVILSYGADGAPGGEGEEADLDSRELLRRETRERRS